MQIKGMISQFFSDFWPALTSGMMGSMLGLAMGVNIHGRFFGIFVYVFFTIICSVVLFTFTGLVFDGALKEYLATRLVITGLVSSLCYVSYYVIWALLKQVAKKPVETLSKLKNGNNK